MKLLQLVDSVEYVKNNCFQHQLLRTFKTFENVQTVTLDQLYSTPFTYDGIISCLKQRTLARNIVEIQKRVGHCPINVYDQDPWTAYEDNSPFKGTYLRVFDTLNVKSFSVTTKFWSDYILQQGLPGRFVRMWILPEYCDVGLDYDHRHIQLGFVGTIHPHRKKMFEQLEAYKVPLTIQAGNVLSYKDYLKQLSCMKVFIHCEDSIVSVDQKNIQLGGYALWIKDVEAAARGCFTIRNRGEGSESYYEGLQTTMLYDNVSEIAGIFDSIENMHVDDRRLKINETVSYIQHHNKWQETALALTTFNV